MKKYVLVVLTLLLLVGCSKQKNKDNLMIDLKEYNINEIKDYALDNNLELEINYKNSVLKKDSYISQSIKVGKNLKNEKKLIIELSSGRLDNEEYQKYNVNELGRVPVMMYHGIHNKKNSETPYTGGNVDYDGYQRTAEAFRNDLEFYYQNGYRMVRLQDYIDGYIDVELGKSPIVLTFDDGLENNIKVLGLNKNGEIIIDPNSAVGILEEFKKKYPDFNVTATFFINGSLFNQPDYDDEILNWLIKNGYDIGNHTYSHVNFKNVDKIKSQMEVGKMYQILDSYIKDKYVNIVALPFGSPGKIDHENFPYILKGTYDGYNYETLSCLRVGWEADYSPFSKSFNKTFIKRIRAYDNDGIDFDISYNFDILKNTRYISDGNPNNVVIKSSDQEYYNDIYDLELITY